ncbi:MAG: GNAT family N-acetyltransferase [Firmicutes bacterium]|jgi:GNAT superfamily N-acetyltransferase|nr:GNAT family N-acetyltransferase [Bacillota bacterium]MDH7495602.1 GNAT family N-acetyltransferase [Bacillota bacterium]
MESVRLGEIMAEDIDSLNQMCVPSGVCADELSKLLQESRAAQLHALEMGARVFGAFLEGEPVGRVEVMPIEAAPLPLEGEGLWVIRCLWVLEKARGRGIARSLMELALKASERARGTAVLTYPDWMPTGFFERFGFAVVGWGGSGIVLLRSSDPGARVTFVPVVRKAESSGSEVRVEAVLNARCPWMARYYRTRLAHARSISDRVTTEEYVVHTREDALRFGEENLYVDGKPAFAGLAGLDELERVVRERLAAKGLD